MIMKAHTYYIIFGRPPMGGGGGSFPPGGAAHFRNPRLLYVDALRGRPIIDRYRDLTICKMTAVRHFGFIKFKIFNG